MSKTEEYDLADSDESDDEDYRPENIKDSEDDDNISSDDDADETDDLSEDENGDDDIKDTSKTQKLRKRKCKTKSKSKRKRLNNGKSKTNTENNKKEDDDLKNQEEDKEKTSSLWEDFIKDVGDVGAKNTKKINDVNSINKKTESQIENEKNTVTDKEKNLFNDQKNDKISEFASVEIKIGKEILSHDLKSKPLPSSSSNVRDREKLLICDPRPKSGIKSLLGAFNDGKKMSILEQTKMDWHKFKNNQNGLAEEIKTYNKGKSGFLERRDFLQRTDYKQFENESALRKKLRKIN